MEHFPLTVDEFRYLRKHKINLETRFHLKIFMPEVFNHFSTVATTYGDKQETQNLRNLLKQKTGVLSTNCVMVNPIPPNPVPLITLSDTESETPVLCETTQKKRKKNKKKRKISSGNSSPVPVMEEPTIDNIPESKRMKTESTSLAESFIPLSITSDVKGVRSVKLTSKTNSQEADDSILIIEDTVQNLSCSSKENDGSIVLDTSTFEEDPRPVCLGYVIDRSPIIKEDTVQYNSSSSKGNDDSIVLLNTVEEVPRPVCRQLRFAIDKSPIVEEDTVHYNSSSSKENDDSIVLLDTVEEVVRPVSGHLRYVIDRSSIIEKDTVHYNSSSSKENDDSIVLLDTVEEVPRLVSGHLRYVIDRSSIVEEDPVQYNSSSSKENDDSIFLLDTVEEVPRPASGQLSYVIDRSPSIKENIVQYNSSRPRQNGESIVLVGVSPVENIPRPVAVRLRPIVIDGSNIARDHGRGKGDKNKKGIPTDTFSCRGIQISVQFFLERGHSQVTVFIPKFRKHQTLGHCPSTDVHLLDELERDQHLSYTPSRRIEGRLMQCYDDRFIVQLAASTGGVILSNDNYKDIMNESESFKKTIQERLLMFCFVGDILMVPEDPLGRHGLRLKELLAFPENESHSPN